MSTSAIIVMTISMVLLWGGAIVAIVRISRHPDTQRQEAKGIDPGSDPEPAGAVPQDATPGTAADRDAGSGPPGETPGNGR